MEIYPESNASQPPKKSEQLQRTPDHSIPAFAGGQREAILKMLRAAGAQGVSKEILLYEKHWSQAAARIFELERLGYRISHVLLASEKYVRYILLDEPEHEEPLSNQPREADPHQGSLANSPDWYTRESGRERQEEPTPDLGPLFDEAVRP
jgi:hypothetical protein